MQRKTRRWAAFGLAMTLTMATGAWASPYKSDAMTTQPTATTQFTDGTSNTVIFAEMIWRWLTLQPQK